MATPPHILKLREKIGHETLQLPGVTGIVINSQGEVLLQKRSDTNVWHTLGGVCELNETPASACIREIKEETGIEARIARLIGVYGPVDVVYHNGDRCSFLSTTFLCQPVDEMEIPYVADGESVEVRYFKPNELPNLKPYALQKIRDALSGRAEAFFEYDDSK